MEKIASDQSINLLVVVLCSPDFLDSKGKSQQAQFNLRKELCDLEPLRDDIIVPSES